MSVSCLTSTGFTHLQHMCDISHSAQQQPTKHHRALVPSPPQSQSQPAATNSDSTHDRAIVRQPKEPEQRKARGPRGGAGDRRCAHGGGVGPGEGRAGIAAGGGDLSDSRHAQCHDAGVHCWARGGLVGRSNRVGVAVWPMAELLFVFMFECV